MRALIAIPVLLVLVLFALSNRGTVTLRLWPTDFAWNAPLSLAVLVVAAVFFVAGALLGWSGTVPLRRRARRAEAALRLLEAQRPVALPPPEA